MNAKSNTVETRLTALFATQRAKHNTGAEQILRAKEYSGPRSARPKARSAGPHESIDVEDEAMLQKKWNFLQYYFICESVKDKASGFPHTLSSSLTGITPVSTIICSSRGNTVHVD